MIVETQVGSKGELFLSKQIRDSLGLKPEQRVSFASFAGFARDAFDSGFASSV